MKPTLTLNLTITIQLISALTLAVDLIITLNRILCTAYNDTPTHTTTATPKGKLQAAIRQCLQLSSDCSKGPHGPIGSWDVSVLTDMSQMFNQDAVPGANKFAGDISDWDVSRVTTMWAMFYSASSFDGDLSKWDVSSVTDMSYMFCGASSFNGDISKWDVSSVTNMRTMFARASSLNCDISKWDVSKVTDMEEMFSSASLFNGDISDWDVSRVENMLAMFYKASSFNGDIAKWDVSRVINMEDMFSGASSFTQTLCFAWYTSKADKDGMFTDSSGRMCTDSLITLPTTTTSTSKITFMAMFLNITLTLISKILGSLAKP